MLPTNNGYLYDSTAFHADPLSDAATLYWWNALRGLIIKSHPHFSRLGLGDVSHEDLHQDGAAAVISALKEYDPKYWDKNIGAFLRIRVPQRLHDLNRENRRARTVVGILEPFIEQEIAMEANESALTDEAALLMAIKAGKWPNWLGLPSVEKVAESRRILGNAFSALTSSLDELVLLGDEELGSRGACLADPHVNVENEALGDDVNERLRHVIGIDRDLLSEETSDGDIVLVSYGVQGVDAAQARRDARKFALSREALESGNAKVWRTRTIQSCTRCGLVWPLKTDGLCNRIECNYGERQVPEGFTKKYWTTFYQLWLDTSPNDFYFTQMWIKLEQVVQAYSDGEVGSEGAKFASYLLSQRPLRSVTVETAVRITNMDSVEQVADTLDFLQRQKVFAARKKAKKAELIS